MPDLPPEIYVPVASALIAGYGAIIGIASMIVKALWNRNIVVIERVYAIGDRTAESLTSVNTTVKELNVALGSVRGTLEEVSRAIIRRTESLD